MKRKVFALNMKSQNLVRLAEDNFNKKRYYSGLRMLYKKIDTYGGEVSDWSFLAEVYDDMELFDLSIKYWFKYLAECEEEDLPEAYEGLAAAYYNIGNEPQSAYYYNKLLTVDREIPTESKMEIAKMFTGTKSSKFRITYPPEKADYSEEIDSGVKLLREHDYEKAKEKFERVSPLSKQASLAKNYLAICHLVTGNSQAAENECLEIIEKNPKDIQALATYCAILVEKQEKEKAQEVASKLCEIQTDNPDELYKIATVCCESGLHEKAYEKFVILEKTVKYDITLLYFKAVAAFKSAKYKECLDDLYKILSVFPQAEVVRYYYNKLRGYLEDENELPVEMNYFYKIPQAERAERVKTLAVLLELKVPDLKLFSEEFDLIPLLRWCFDEFDGQEPELQLLAVRIAHRLNQTEFLREILLDSSVNDVIKIEALKLVLEKNKDIEISVVLCDIFRKINFEHGFFGRTKKKLFISAYVQSVIKQCILGDDDCSEYCDAVNFLYAELEYKNSLSIVDDETCLACAIIVLATKPKDIETVIASFRCDKEKVEKILDAVFEGVDYEID